MDKEKPHHSTLSTTTTSNKSEFFVCFTSRLSSSSSSMKLSSKSILSPSRNRDPPQISLSSSLSRRLKSNGSMKGGQASPMFPTVGKRRGCGFENPEPSSPKVTCIGQVRVKTKKQGKKMRSRSKRRGNGEASFRRGGTEQGFHQVGGGSVGSSNPDLTRQNSQSYQYQNHQNLQQECLKHRNQRWVHLPLTICEALREFSCFFPCRSSCMSKEKSGGELLEVRGSGRESSCGFARWLVALQDGEGKGRGIELVMEHEEEMEMMEELEMENEQGERSHSQRRHIFEDLDIDVVEGKEQRELEDGGEEEEEEKGRVSICIPPKNALLLMRCRSDPVKMAALANRFWESPLHKDQPEEEQEENENSRDEEEQEQVEEEDQQEEKEDEEGYKDQHIEMEQVEEVVVESKTLEEEEDSIICERETEEASFVVELEKAETEEEIGSRTNEEISESEAMEVKEQDEDDEDTNDHKVEDFSCVLLTEADADLEKPKLEDTHEVKVEENDPNVKENEEKSELYSSEPENNEEEAKTVEGLTEEEEEAGAEEEEEGKDEIENPTHQGSDLNPESTEREKGSKEVEREKDTLPECLLLMMCEPKLSMEVSKETWVCSTDFVRWLPERPAGKPAGGTKRVIAESSSKPKPKVKQHQPLMQPPRSSCSFPVTGGGGGMSMATMIEQKLVGASKSRNGYEPFVLTRCKSEPMSSAAAKLAPEACFWNNRKLEPHPPSASLGVGAPAGVGF